MKILQVVHYFLPRHRAGTEIYTYNLAKELAKRHQVFIFCSEDGPAAERYQMKEDDISGLPVCRISYDRPQGFIETFKNDAIEERFEQYLDRIQPDIIHFQHLFRLSASLISVAKRRGIPSVLTLADYWFICPQIQMLKPNLELCSGPAGGINCLTCGSAVPFIYYVSDFFAFLPEPSREMIQKLLHWAKKGIPNILLKGFFTLKSLLKSSYPEATGSLTYYRLQYLLKLLNMANLVIAPSRFLREKFLAAGIDEEKIIYSDYGFNQLPFKNFTPQKSGNLRFGFIGTITENKGVHLLIEAFNKLNDELAELRIYGSPEVNPKYFSRIEKLVKNPRIKLLGGFANEDIAKILSEVDIIIVPSIWWENSPLTIHEAFMAGVPVIASNIGGMAELVQDGVNGYLFKVGDPEDLRDKIKSIIDKPEQIAELKKGIPPVKSIEENAAELESIYKSINPKH